MKGTTNEHELEGTATMREEDANVAAMVKAGAPFGGRDWGTLEVTTTPREQT